MRRRAVHFQVLSHLKADDRTPVLDTAHYSRAVGVAGSNRMEELIAQPHAIYLWLTPASAAAMMKHMRLRLGERALPHGRR